MELIFSDGMKSMGDAKLRSGGYAADLAITVHILFQAKWQHSVSDSAGHMRAKLLLSISLS